MRFLIGMMRYTWLRAKHRIIYSKLVRVLYIRVKIELEFFVISRRLERRQYSEKEIMIIVSRFFRRKVYRVKQDSKEAHRDLSQFIVKYSARTGIPQWEIRTMLNEDFNIDV